MTERCSYRFLPRLERLPPAPAPEPGYRPEEARLWQNRLADLAREYETVRADQFRSPLSQEELEQIEQIYLDAMERCRLRAAACAPLE